MDAAVAGRLGQARDAELVEERADLAGSLLHHRERDAGARIEVDAELVGMLGVGCLRRPDVEPEAAQVHRPEHVREVGGDQRP